jgi:hypothetical protein
MGIAAMRAVKPLKLLGSPLNRESIASIHMLIDKFQI